jgi:hypothetical protein
MTLESPLSRRPADHWLWVAAAISIALGLTSWGQLPLCPFRLLTTWVHECGHAIVTILVGGSVNAIMIATDTSGVTQSVIPASRIAQGLVASSGYLGASVAGCLLLAARRREKWAGAIIWAVGAFMLLTLVIWIRNLFGFAVVLIWGLGLMALSRKGSGDASPFVLSLLAIQVALNAIYDIRFLWVVRGGHSDAEAMARLFLLPSWLWAGAWMLMSVGMLVWTLLTTRRRTAGASGR